MQAFQPQTKLQFLTKLIGVPQLFILIILLFALVFYSTSTSYVPSWKMMNVTGADNQTIEVVGIYSYAQKDYVVKAREYEYENSQVPKSDFPLEGALLIFGLIIAIVILYLKKKDFKQVKTKEEIEALARQYYDRLKREEEIIDYSLTTGAKLSKTKVDNGELVYNTWNLFVDVQAKDKEYQHRMLVFHPYNGLLEWDLNFGKTIMAEDVCPNCGNGKLSDLHLVTPEGYKLWKENFGQRVYQS